MSIELNTKSMRLEFDEETGAVYRITALKTGWDIMEQPGKRAVLEDYDSAV
mgnify:CR=1 FL=1